MIELQLQQPQQDQDGIIMKWLLEYLISRNAPDQLIQDLHNLFLEKEKIEFYKETLRLYISHDGRASLNRSKRFQNFFKTPRNQCKLKKGTDEASPWKYSVLKKFADNNNVVRNDIVNSVVNPAMNPGMNSFMNPGMNTAINRMMNPMMIPRTNTFMNPAMNEVVNPTMNPGMNTVMNDVVYPIMNLGMNMNEVSPPIMNPTMNPGMNIVMNDVYPIMNPGMNEVMNPAMNEVVNPELIAPSPMSYHWHTEMKKKMTFHETPRRSVDTKNISTSSTNHPVINPVTSSANYPVNHVENTNPILIALTPRNYHWDTDRKRKLTLHGMNLGNNYNIVTSTDHKNIIGHCTISTINGVSSESSIILRFPDELKPGEYVLMTPSSQSYLAYKVKTSGAVPTKEIASNTYSLQSDNDFLSFPQTIERNLFNPSDTLGLEISRNSNGDEYLTLYSEEPPCPSVNVHTTNLIGIPFPVEMTVEEIQQQIHNNGQMKKI